MTEQEIAVELANHEARLCVVEQTVSKLQDLILSVKELTISVKNLTEKTNDLSVRLTAKEQESVNDVKYYKREMIKSALLVGVTAIVEYLIIAI